MYVVRTGGLMRCCLATLDAAMLASQVPPKEGDILPCRYHPQDNSMIFRDGGWEWNAPKESRKSPE